MKCAFVLGVAICMSLAVATGCQKTATAQDNSAATAATPCDRCAGF